MAFPPGFLDELRERTPLSALVGRRVKLERRGREYAGLCPFHHEKTPSFFVVEDKGFFHCFGCGAHGDAIGFLMRAERLDFIEAVEKLAGEAGLAMPSSSPEERERAQKQKGLVDALEAACAYYEAELWGAHGRAARDYLKARGLDSETVRNFRLGWAPSDRGALLRALGGEFPEALLVEAGLARRSEEGGAFAYLRDRIVFPITDRRGRVIAFGGRLIAAGEPKYLNSPDSPLFQKGRVLYGAALAAGALRTEASEAKLVVVEGYMDVLALHRCGLRGAVAPLGTALGEEQLALLWRLSPEPVLCFDGDRAGQNAAWRALKRALPLLRPGQSLSFAVLPAGEDPDSLIRAKGRAAFEEIVGASQPLWKMLFQTELAAGPTNTPERRAGLESRLKAAAEEIADKSVRRQFYSELMRAFNATTNPPRPQRRGAAAKSGAGFESPPPLPRSREPVLREILFRILLRSPELLAEVAEEFAALDLQERELDILRRAILEAFDLHPGLDAHGLQQHLLPCGLAATVERLLGPSVDTGFLVRQSGGAEARRAWDHVVGMLGRENRRRLAESANRIRSDDTMESWQQRAPSALEQVLRQPPYVEE